MAAAGLLEVARGGEHPSFKEMSVKPMHLLPPLPPNTTPSYARILEMHVSWAAHNRKVENHKATMQLIYADQVYASIEAACKKTAPLFHEKLRDACDYAKTRPEYPMLNGHFDGARGWAMLMIHLAPKVRTREDREFYNAARDLQLKHHLPDHCHVKQFRDKALAFATKINPGLVQRYTGEDAGVYILELLPRGLAADMRRLETQLRAAGRGRREGRD